MATQQELTDRADAIELQAIRDYIKREPWKSEKVPTDLDRIIDLLKSARAYIANVQLTEAGSQLDKTGY